MAKVKTNGGGANGASSSRRDLLLDLYMKGVTVADMARRIKVSRQRVYQLIRKYKFLPQSRYMLEGALCREWLLRHNPAVFHRIVGEAAEQHQGDSTI